MATPTERKTAAERREAVLGAALLEFAERGGDLTFGTEEERAASEARIGRMLTLIVASREYQFA